MTGFIQNIFMMIPGMIIAGGLVAFIYKRDAVDWEKLMAAYGRDWKTPLAKRHLQSLILYSEGRPAKTYKGIITIGLNENGMALRPLFLFAPFMKPIFVPYTEIQGWKQKWYIDAKSAEIAFDRTPAMRIIMPADQVKWIADFTDGKIKVHDSYPSHGNWPWLTFTIAVVFGFSTLFLIVFLLFKYFNQ